MEKGGCALNDFEEQDYSKQYDWALWKKILQFCKPYKKNFTYLISWQSRIVVIDNSNINSGD